MMNPHLIFRGEDEQSMVCAVIFLHTELGGSRNQIAQGRGMPIVERQQSGRSSTSKDKGHSLMVLEGKEKLQ